MDEWVYWVALRSIKGIGPITIRNLINRFGSPQRVFRASKEELSLVEGVGESTYYLLKEGVDWKEAKREVDRVRKEGYKLVTLTDEDYPQNLLSIYDPPPYLYVLGELSKEDEHSIAVVGSRLCDGYGKRVAQEIAMGLSERGITVVSGVAKGIDAISHTAAIEAGGRTVGVLGNGVDVVYPLANRHLYKQIPKKGALISEFSLQTPPDASNFPRRNRLISGVSMGVVVIQASKNSGSLITAYFALEQNREVFAVPGSVFSKLSGGCNELIKNGAKLVESVEDIIEEIPSLKHMCSGFLTHEKRNKKEVSNLTPIQKRVLDLLKERPYHIDEISLKLDMDIPSTLSTMLELELLGMVEQTPGKVFQLI